MCCWRYGSNILFMVSCFISAPPYLYFIWQLMNRKVKYGMAFSGSLELFICNKCRLQKVFCRESSGRMLYFYSIAGPRGFCTGKTIFNSLLMLVMSVLSLILFTLFFGNPIEKAATFTGIVLLGGWGLSLVFTFLAAIAAKARQNAAIMAILGFPIIIPQLILLMQLSKAAFSATLTVPPQNVLLLVALNVMVILLAVILFPFLWKDKVCHTSTYKTFNL